MSSIINSTTTSPGGLISTGDSSNSLLIQTGDTTAITINSSQQVALTNPLGTASGGTGLSTVGTNGQVLSSNGSTLSWTTPSAGFSGSTTTSSATDITLTNTSTQTQYVSMTAADKFVILPDATTLATKGAPIFVIVNTGQYPFHIKDGGGNIIYYNLLQNQTITLTLIDNSAAIGKWASEYGLLQLSSGLPQLSSITAVFDGQREPAVAMLSATEALIFYQPTASSLSVVLATISGTSVSYGTPVTVAASGVSYTRMKALAFNSTTGVICYYTTTPNWVLRAVTVSGSTVTVGSATNLTASNGRDTENSGFMAMLNSTTGFVGYANSIPDTYARAFTISGTTITLGTAVVLNGITSEGEFYFATQISSGKVLVGYRDNSTTYIRACTNSGTTLTLGTARNVTGAPGVAVEYGTYEKISTDAASGVFLQYYGITVTVSGTTTAAPTQYLIAAGQPYGSPKVKYLSDGLQLGYGTASLTPFLWLYKGNSSSAPMSVPAQKLGLPIGDGARTALGVNGGNQGIYVAVFNGYVASQVIGVLY